MKEDKVLLPEWEMFSLSEKERKNIGGTLKLLSIEMIINNRPIKEYLLKESKDSINCPNNIY